jgi:hypothetical protein
MDLEEVGGSSGGIDDVTPDTGEVGPLGTKLDDEEGPPSCLSILSILSCESSSFLGFNGPSDFPFTTAADHLSTSSPTSGCSPTMGLPLFEGADKRLERTKSVPVPKVGRTAVDPWPSVTNQIYPEPARPSAAEENVDLSWSSPP